jgi:hypothetical protein
MARRPLRTAKKRDRVSCKTLTPSREPEPVSGRRANRDAIRLRAHGSGEPGAHLGTGRRDPGPLPNEHAIRIHELEASFANDLTGVLKEADR